MQSDKKNPRVSWSPEELKLLFDLIENVPGPGGNKSLKHLLDHSSARDNFLLRE